MLVAGPLPLATQYHREAALDRCERVATNHAVATNMQAGYTLPICAIVWLSINRARFVQEECSNG